MTIPRLRAGSVKRFNLVTRINTGLQHSIVLVSAPAGFGKTTLLVEWAAQSVVPVAWLSLDERDNTPSAFVHCLFLSIKTISPGFELGEVKIVKESDPLDNFKSDLTNWINELESHKSEIALVLEDFHFITDPVILKGMEFLFEHLPANLHLLITSRSVPNIALARLRARNQLDELRAPDLKFTYDESRVFLRGTMGLKLNDAETKELENRTEGWVAGLQLAAISLLNQSPVADLSGLISGDNTYILDFLVEEVFDQQTQDVQDFLLRTSILENLTGALCDAVAAPATFTGHGQQLLRSFYRSNLFITALDPYYNW